MARNGIRSVTKEYRSRTTMGLDLEDDLNAGVYSRYGGAIEDHMRNFFVNESDNELARNRRSLFTALAAFTPASTVVNLVSSMLFTKSSSSIQHFGGLLDLKGELFDETSTTSYRIPYSGGIRSRFPVYAFGKSAGQRKLGLFHFIRNPSIRSSSDTYLESPGCLVVMNPSSKSRLTDAFGVLAGPVQALPAEYANMINVDPLFLRLRGHWEWKLTQTTLNFADPRLLTDDGFTASERNAVFVVTLQRELQSDPFERFFDQNILQSQGKLRSVCLETGNDFNKNYFTVGATDGVTLNDRVHVFQEKGILGSTWSRGSTMLGADAVVGELWSFYFAELRDRAAVTRRLVASRLLMQNAQTNNVSGIFEVHNTQGFPVFGGITNEMSQVVVSPVFQAPSVELDGECRLSGFTPSSQSLPYCDKSAVSADWASYQGFLDADKKAKIPLWCQAGTYPPGTMTYEQHMAERFKQLHPVCVRAREIYQPISYEEYIAGAVGMRLVLPPGQYGRISIKSGYTLELQAGTYHIQDLQMESGSKIDVKNADSWTELYLYGSLIWRAEVGAVDPARLRMLYVGPPRDLYLETPFNGSIFAPYARLVMGQRTECVYYGRYFARFVEIHQGTVVVGVPFIGGVND